MASTWSILLLIGLSQIIQNKAVAPVYIYLDESEAGLRNLLMEANSRMSKLGVPLTTSTFLINKTNVYSSILEAYENPDHWSAILDLTSIRTCILAEIAWTNARPYLALADAGCSWKRKSIPSSITPPDQMYLDAVMAVVQTVNFTNQPMHIAVFYDQDFDGTLIPKETGWNSTVFYFLFRLRSSANDTWKLLTNLRKDVDVSTFIVLASKPNVEILLRQAQALKMLGTNGLYYHWFLVTKDDSKINCSNCTGTDVIHLSLLIQKVDELRKIKDYLATINTSLSWDKAAYARDSLRAIFQFLLVKIAQSNKTPVHDSEELPFIRFLQKKLIDGIFGRVGVSEDKQEPDLTLDIEKLNGENRKKIGAWSTRRGVKLFSDLFPNNAPYPTMTVLTLEEPPFVMVKVDPDDPNNVTYEGYTFDVLNKIANELDFRIDVTTLDRFTKRGMEEFDAPYDEMVQILADGKVDMVAATLSVTLNRSEKVDFTISYYDYAGIQILMKKQTKNKNMFDFLTVFSWGVWVTIAGTLVLMTSLVHVLDRFSPFSYRNRRDLYREGGRVYTIKESAWFVMGSFTKSGEGDSPKACSSRLLVAGYWFFCMVIMATFTANLAAFLTASRLKNRVESLEDLSKSNMEYSVVKGHDAADYFRHMAKIEMTFYDRWKEMSLGNEQGDKSTSRNAYQYAVWDYPLGDKFTKIWTSIENATLLNSTQEGVRKAATDEKFAFLHMAPVLKYEAGLHCELTVVGEQFSNKPFAFALQKNSPMTKKITNEILGLQRNRELETLKQDWWEKKKANCSDDSNESSGITMETVGGVFIAMTIGIGLCLIALVAEVTCTKYRRPKTSQVTMTNGADKPREMYPELDTIQRRVSLEKRQDHITY